MVDVFMGYTYRQLACTGYLCIVFRGYKRAKNTLFSIKVHFFRIFLPKNLHISKIFSTFVPDLEKELITT